MQSEGVEEGDHDLQLQTPSSSPWEGYHVRAQQKGEDGCWMDAQVIVERRPSSQQVTLDDDADVREHEPAVRVVGENRGWAEEC